VDACAVDVVEVTVGALVVDELVEPVVVEIAADVVVVAALAGVV
jgi:hypothetical protein